MQEASNLFRQSHEANPGDTRTLLLWGLLERRQRNWATARDLFRKGTAITDQDPLLYQARPLPLPTPSKQQASKLSYKDTGEPARQIRG